ncbi:hypothetical protein J7J12_02465 [bacterium]|nr:hypothetical protein [bacterium]
MIKRESTASKDSSTQESQETTLPKRQYGILHLIGGLILLFIIIGILVNLGEKKEGKSRPAQVSQSQVTQEQQIQKGSQEKVQEEIYTCVYRDCDDESSCDDFCRRMGYSGCGGNACWEQDPNYQAVKHLMRYSSENYCQCSEKLKGVKYEDEIPYGQCSSTGSCNLVCSWINQTCLKAGCSCRK